MVSRHGEPDCIVHFEPFVCVHEVENPLLEVVKHADLHCMEQVGLQVMTHNIGIMSKHVESSVNMARQEFVTSCIVICIVEHSIQVVIPPGVLLVTSDIISKFVRWTFAPYTGMPLEMVYVTILWAL